MIYFTTRLSTRGTSATRDGIASASAGLITISSHAVRRYSRGAFESDHLRAVSRRGHWSHATQDAKRFVVIVTCMTAMVLLVNNHAREFGRDSILLFVWIRVAIGFLDTLADPEEGRRVLASCGVKVTRLRSTLTALLVWFVLVSIVRTLAITVFEVVTDFNAERGNPENGKV